MIWHTEKNNILNFRRQPLRWLAEIFAFLLALVIAGPLFSQSIRYVIGDSSAGGESQTRRDVEHHPNWRLAVESESGGQSRLVSTPSLGLVAMDRELFQIIGTARSPIARRLSSSRGDTRLGSSDAEEDVGRITRNFDILALAGHTLVSRVSQTTVQVQSPLEEWSQEVILPEGIGHAALSPNGIWMVVASADRDRVVLYQVEENMVRRIRSLALSSAGAAIAAVSTDNKSRLIGVLTQLHNERVLFASRDGLGFQQIGAFSGSARMLVDPAGRFLSVVEPSEGRLYEYRPSTIGFALTNTLDFGAESLIDPFPIAVKGSARLIGIRDGFIAVCINDGECSSGSVSARTISEVIPSASDGSFLVRVGTEGRRLVAISFTTEQEARISSVVNQTRTSRRAAGTRQPVLRQ